jgi:5-methyltetrahydrofolate--homocysteine methyltransferase
MTTARAAIDRFVAGGVILPDLLGSLESIETHGQPAGKVLVATLEGDVHAIGHALLVTVLRAAGYTVLDLGKQVSVEAIVDATRREAPDALGLSALLVTTSRQMPLCIQALDAADLHVPVLIGGAAITRAFGHRAALLADGRLYEPGVFYCKDVFEGLATLDAVLDPARREQMHIPSGPPAPARATRTTAPAPRPREIQTPTPPYQGARRRNVDLADVWRTSLDRQTLFRFHWGGYRANEGDYTRLLGDRFEPALSALTRDALEQRWLEPRVVIGYFLCNSDGDSLLVFDPSDRTSTAARLEFPRQADGDQLCLADYFRPLSSGEPDIVALQAVTTGPRAGGYVEELQRSGHFERMLLVNGLASATAEALAEHAQQLVRHDLGLATEQGLRFSWGYAACPDLDEQRKVLPLLRTSEQIGLTLTQSDNLDPEHSTVAIVVHHPEAKYFSVR